MKLTPIQALVPGRVMIGMLVVIGLSLAWYLNSAGATADHLTRRNFNHLNQIGQNIGASIETLGRQVRFNLESDCHGYGTSEKQWEAAEKCVARSMSEMLEVSPLVNDASKVQFYTESFAPWNPAAPNADKMCKPGDYGGFEYKDPAQLERGSILVEVAADHARPAVLAVIAPAPMPAQVMEGFEGLVGVEDVEAMEAAALREAGQSRPEWVCPSEFLRTYAALELDLSLVDGLAQREGYFDTIIIARTVHREESGKEADGEGGEEEDWYYDEGLPEILYNSAEMPYRAPADDIRRIFQMRNSFERFSSIFDIEYEEAAQRERSSGFAELAEERGDDKEVKIRPLMKSTVVPIDIGGFEQLAFVQPLHLDDVYQANEELVIIGIVGRSSFNELKYAVPYNELLLLLLILFTGVLSLNFIRLLLLQRRSVLHKMDVYFSHMSLLGVAALFAVMLANWFATREFDRQFEYDKQSIADQLLVSFNRELGDKLRYLRDFNFAGADLGENATSSHPCRPLPASPGAVRRAPPSPIHSKIECATANVPGASSIFQLDSSGRQVGRYYSFNRYTTESGFSVNKREYFRAIRDERAWIYEALDDEHRALSGQPFYIQRIESLADGTLETAMSVPVPGADSSRAAGGPIVQAMATRMHSLESAVLPPGFGFAIFENYSGRVLYHSVSSRSLRENFYHATDDDADLKARVVSGATADLSLDYGGNTVSARVQALEGLPWTLAVYYRKPLLDVVNFQFSVTAAVLAGSYILVFMLLAALGSYLKCKLEEPGITEQGYQPPIFLIPPWTYPRIGRGAAYVRLSCMYFAVALLYLGVIYYLNIDDSIWWMLAVPAVIFWLWHWQVEPKYHRRLPLSIQGVVLRFMPLAVIILLIIYILKIIHGGGAVFLAISAVLVLLASAFQRWKARRLRDAEKRAINPIFSDKDRRDARAVALASTISHYRAVATQFVLFLAVFPTLMFHNENFDVHEKLWVEYANWSNVDRIKARSRDLKRYVGKMHHSSGAADQESTRRNLVREFVKDDWQGVYLPRTRAQVLDARLISASCESREQGPPEARQEMPEWPEIQIPPGGSPDMRPELMSYLLVVEDVDEVGETCHPHTTLDGDITLKPADNADVESQLGYLRSLIQALPQLSASGAILKSFSDSSDRARTHGDREQLSMIMEESASRPPGYPGLIVMDEFDPTTSLHYLTSAAFPHTRSASSHFIFIPYILYILLTGVLVWFISGFMMRRQMATRLAGQVGHIDATRLEDYVASSCVLVVPVTRTMPWAMEQLTSQLNTTVSAVEGRQADYLFQDPGTNVLVLRDFASLLQHRQRSQATLSHIESFLDVEGNRRLFILSEVDPEYWLRHEHLVDNMPDEERHRWEAVLRPLRTCTLQRGTGEVPPAAYRQAWELSSPDERVMLGGLHYERVLNYKNLGSCTSLYRRGLLRFRDFQLYFDDNPWEFFVSQQIREDQFKAQAGRYQNELWVSVRGPLLLALFVVVLFIAYVAQNEMRMIFSLVGTVGGALATLGMLSQRFRDFRSYLED